MAAGPESPRSSDEGHPVLVGVIALAGVGLVVGLLISVVALAGTSVLGLGESGGDGTGQATSGESMILPTPTPTPTPEGPLITLQPVPTTETPEASPSESETPETAITLSASPAQVSPMQQVDLTGTYTGGNGAVVQVQRFLDGGWVPFADITARVNGQTFSTFIQTGNPGENRFRVVDLASGLESNEVTFTVG